MKPRTAFELGKLYGELFSVYLDLNKAFAITGAVGDSIDTNKMKSADNALKRLSKIILRIDEMVGEDDTSD